MIRVIHAAPIWGSMVHDLVVPLFEPGDQRGAQVAGSMVVCQVYPHGHKFRRSGRNPNAHWIVNSHPFLWETNPKKNLRIWSSPRLVKTRRNHLFSSGGFLLNLPTEKRGCEQGERTQFPQFQFFPSNSDCEELSLSVDSDQVDVVIERGRKQISREWTCPPNLAASFFLRFHRPMTNSISFRKEE